MYIFILFTLILLLGKQVSCGPKIYQDSNYEALNRYHESTLSEQKNYSKPEKKESRFGILPISPSSYGNNGNGASNGGYGYAISPVMKIDIGGVALGAILGLGLVLLVPKLANIIGAGGYGYRSLEGEMSSISDFLARIDNSLEQQNIDSTSCIQNLICSYVNNAQKNINNGEASGLDEFVSSLTNHTAFTYMLDGTAIKQAAEIGKNAENIDKCSNSFPRCQLTKENLLKIVANFIPV